METLKAQHFSSNQELTQFVNSNRISRAQILSIVRGQAQDYTLFYY